MIERAREALEVAARRERKYELATRGLAWWWANEDLRREAEALRNEVARLNAQTCCVDRAALLALADEIDADTDALLSDTSLIVGGVGLMRVYACRIREAVGEPKS